MNKLSLDEGADWLRRQEANNTDVRCLGLVLWFNIAHVIALFSLYAFAATSLLATWLLAMLLAIGWTAAVVAIGCWRNRHSS